MGRWRREGKWDGGGGGKKLEGQGSGSAGKRRPGGCSVD